MDEEPDPSTGQDELFGALSKADTMENIIVQWGHFGQLLQMQN